MTMPDLTATSLVLEGGGFRGIYTSGVLDYFMEQGLYLPQVYGICRCAQRTGLRCQTTRQNRTDQFPLLP